MIRLTIDNNPIKIDWLEFSDGATTCKLIDCPSSFKTAWVTVDPITPVKDILMEVLLVRSALGYSNNSTEYKVGLNIPYCPYARADRVFEHGNPLPIEVFLEIITERFDEIRTVDLHNPDWADYCGLNDMPQYIAISEVVHNLKQYDYVVAPDKGALKKIYELGMPVITATKVRDVSTGRIVETTLDTDVDLTGCKLLIVDDICDYGNTFINLAKLLKTKGAVVHLYVTHLIKPNGLSDFKDIVDYIYCYNTVGGYINNTHILDFNNGK